MKAHKLDMYQTSSDSLTVDEITLNSRLITDFSDITPPTVRQTYLSGPDLIGVDATSTIETAATKTGDLRSAYHDLGVDMLTGSRGGMLFEVDKTGTAGCRLQSSIFEDTRNLLYTYLTNTLDLSGNRALQFLATGVQLGDNSDLASANLYAFQTTHKTILNGVEWQYNAESGFAMWRYTGTGSAFNLQHPMGKVPLFFAIKDLDAANAWRTGRSGTSAGMILNQTDAESVISTIFTDAPTNTYIALGANASVNGLDDEYFGFGWFGDPLDDLETGMLGERGVTASYIMDTDVQTTYDTGITDIQAVIHKRIDSISSWVINNKATGFDKYTLLDDTTAEATDATLVEVNGSEVTIDRASGRQYLVIVIGSTVDRPDNQLKTDVKVLRKVGTASDNHRVDLGPMTGGTAGGMLMARDVDSVVENIVFSTRTGANYFIRTTGTNVLGFINGSCSFTSTGVTLGSWANINSTNINQYSAFLTTHQITMPDGSYWEYNPLTGFAMCKFLGTALARTIQHPMGKKPRELWFKNLDSATYDWIVYLDSMGSDYIMRLNTSSAEEAAGTVWNSLDHTDSVINLGASSSVNGVGQYIIVYGWFGDDLSDIETGLTGERGVSAFKQVTATTGTPVTFDSGIDSIELVLYKGSSLTSNWVAVNPKVNTQYRLNDTTVEAANATVTVDGSYVTLDLNTGTYEVVIFGSKVDSGIVNDVTLPATISDPAIVSIASGFDSDGVVDIIKKLTTSQTVSITGSVGKKYIMLNQNGNIQFTSNFEYTRDPYYIATDGYTFNIEKMKCFYKDGIEYPRLVIGECMLDSIGNVYDIKTYARGDLWESDWISWLADTYRWIDLPWNHTEFDITVEGTQSGYIWPEFYYRDSGGRGTLWGISDIDGIWVRSYTYANANTTCDEFRITCKRKF